MSLPRLHLITSDAVLAESSFEEVARRLLERCGPAVAVHLRGHATPASRLHTLADSLQQVAVANDAWLLVNDRVDIAMSVRAAGVQLGARSLSVSDARALLGAEARIGCSVHAAEEAVQAEGDGADFVLLGTIYESASHEGRRAAGTGLVRETAECTILGVIAIGGITPERIAPIAMAGAYGAAVLGGIWRAADPVAAAAAYMDAAHAAWH